MTWADADPWAAASRINHDGAAGRDARQERLGKLLAGYDNREYTGNINNSDCVYFTRFTFRHKTRGRAHKFAVNKTDACRRQIATDFIKTGGHCAFNLYLGMLGGIARLSVPGR